MFLEGMGSVAGGTASFGIPAWAAGPCSSEPGCVAKRHRVPPQTGVACLSTPHRLPHLKHK